MTAVADGPITSWSPVTWHALLGEQPTVTRTFARDVSRGSTIVFAPTRRLGACQLPTNVVRRGAGAGAGVCATRLVGVGVARGRGARADADGVIAPEPVRNGLCVFAAGDAADSANGRAVVVADGDAGVGEGAADGDISAGPLAIGVGHALTTGAGDAG